MIGPLTEGQRRNVAVVNSLYKLHQSVLKVGFLWYFSSCHNVNFIALSHAYSPISWWELWQIQLNVELRAAPCYAFVQLSETWLALVSTAMWQIVNITRGLKDVSIENNNISPWLLSHDCGQTEKGEIKKSNTSQISPCIVAVARKCFQNWAQLWIIWIYWLSDANGYTVSVN